jgi:thiamine transport system substrate-binding protein
VYTYDALTGKGSLGELLQREFKKTTGTELNLIPFGSPGEALNQIVIEGESTKADFLLGVDNGFARRALESGLFSPISTKFFKKVDKDINLDSEQLFLPFDYGYVAFLFNNSSIKDKSFLKKPMTLSAFMTSQSIQKKVVIPDPRTSSLGYLFFRWTSEVASDRALKELWGLFIANLLTISPDWSGAYGMFIKGEIDWVLSYTTSRAYHLEKEKKSQYDYMLFEDGHVVQVEGLAQVKFSRKTKFKEAFIELLLSDEIQKNIPTTQWMYPIRKSVSLPATFSSLAIPKIRKIKTDLTEVQRKKLLKDWSGWGSGRL